MPAAALILAVCSWANPGVDPYRGSAEAAIMAKVQIPLFARALLVARVKRNDFDDVVLIDRDSIRSRQYDYDPRISDMAFGKGRRCVVVDRTAWSDSFITSALVFCEAGWCVARPAVCNNWSIIHRLPRRPEPGLGTDAPGRPSFVLAPVQRAADTDAPAVVGTADDGTGAWVAQPEMPVLGVYAAQSRLVTVPAVPEVPVWAALLLGIPLLMWWRR